MDMILNNLISILSYPLTLNHYLILSAVIFSIGLLGAIFNKGNLIAILIAIELMLLSVNMNLVSFSVANNDETGQIYALFVLTVAAAEAAIGLAIIIVCNNNFGSIKLSEINILKN